MDLNILESEQENQMDELSDLDLTTKDSDNNMIKQPLHLAIDGPDRLGKTTVLNLLSRHLNLPIIKMPNSARFIEQKSIEQMSKFFNETIIQFQEFDFLMDRSFLSSKVYNEVFNRGEDLTYLEHIEGILKPKIFIFTGYQRELDEITEINNDWKKIEKKYLDYAHDFGYTVINVNGKSPIELCNQILKNL